MVIIMCVPVPVCNMQLRPGAYMLFAPEIKLRFGSGELGRMEAACMRERCLRLALTMMRKCFEKEVA